MSVGLDSWDSDSDLRWQSSTGNFRRWHILCTSIPPYGPSDVSCRHVESFTMASSTHTFMFRHVSTYRRLTNAEFLFLHSFPNSLSPHNFTSAFHKPFPTGSRERVWKFLWKAKVSEGPDARRVAPGKNSLTSPTVTFHMFYISLNFQP